MQTRLDERAVRESERVHADLAHEQCAARACVAYSPAAGSDRPQRAQPRRLAGGGSRKAAAAAPAPAAAVTPFGTRAWYTRRAQSHWEGLTDGRSALRCKKKVPDHRRRVFFWPLPPSLSLLFLAPLLPCARTQTMPGITLFPIRGSTAASSIYKNRGRTSCFHPSCACPADPAAPPPPLPPVPETLLLPTAAAAALRC
jgi:hypothetical protein